MEFFGSASGTVERSSLFQIPWEKLKCPYLKGWAHFKGSICKLSKSLIQRCPHFRRSLYTEVSSFQEVTVYRGVLISGGHCIQRCPHFRRSLYTEVSSFQEVTVYRGVLISGGHCIQRCPHFRRSLYTEVSSFQEVTVYRGVLISGGHCIQRCPHFRRSLYTEVSISFRGCIRGMHFRGLE